MVSRVKSPTLFQRTLGVFVVLACFLCVLLWLSRGFVQRQIETVYVDFRNTEGLRRDTQDARRDGFTGRLAIHPAQVPVINEVFTPSEAELVKAKAVVAAFAANPGAGAVGLDGKMYDRPHLARAQRLLASVGK